MDYTNTPEGFRSGFMCFVGRPNTGKSTLTNALVGQKIAITANQPETTRHPIRGIVHRDDAQIIVVDTPGLHRPRTLLGERLNEVVKDTYADMDLIAITIPADEKIGPGDRWILDNVRKVAPKTPLMGIVTKIDKVSRDQVALQLMALHKLLGEDSEVVPVSAVTGEQRDILLDVITSLLPEGPKILPPTTTSLTTTLTPASPNSCGKPHSPASKTNCRTPWRLRWTKSIPNPDRPGTLNVHVIIYVERPGQKTILMGKNGRRFKGIIHAARPQICKLLDSNVYLDLRIKVLKNWQSDPKQLGRLGF